ncbi:predicted protein [Arabidopsis lyrata subsp. lyrata]|uniref:Predicted protein n=1 Tax=Arabidopsis lyrata subsp. lyrata TaxID=81972 RepID=D7LMA9_ARALL|nr:predicted protein [Arabidopsis lyrata subsp. lyrata]
MVGNYTGQSAQNGRSKTETKPNWRSGPGGIRQHRHHLQAPAITRDPSLLLRSDSSDMAGVIDSRHKPEVNDGADLKLLSRKRYGGMTTRRLEIVGKIAATTSIRDGSTPPHHRRRTRTVTNRLIRMAHPSTLKI